MTSFRCGTLRKGTIKVKTLRKPGIDAFTFYNVTSSFSEEKLGYADEAGLVSLLGLLNHEHPRIRFLAEETLNSLSKEEGEIIVGEEGFKPLAEMLRYKNLEAQVSSLWTLAMLAGASEQNQEGIINDVGWKTILARSRSQTAEIQRAAVTLLANLSLNEENHEKIIHEEGLAILKSLASSPDIKLKRAVCNAFANLCSDEENVQLVLGDGGVEMLISFLETGDDELISGSLYTLANVASSEEVRGRIIAAGGVGMIITLLTSINVTVQKGAITTVANLVENWEYHDEMVEEGLIDPLLFLARKSKNLEVQFRVASALNTLSSNERMKKVLKEKDAMTPLKLMARSRERDIKREALESLAELGFSAVPKKCALSESKDKAEKDRIAAERAEREEMELHTRSLSFIQREIIEREYGDLQLVDRDQTYLFEKQQYERHREDQDPFDLDLGDRSNQQQRRLGFDLIVKSTNDDKDIDEDFNDEDDELTEEDRREKVMIGLVMMHLWEPADDVSVTESALRKLSLLSLKQRNRKLIRIAGAIPILVERLRSADPKAGLTSVQSLAIGCLATLCRNVRNRGEVRRQNGLLIILRFVQEIKDDLDLLSSLNAIKELAKNDINKVKFRDGKLIERLVALIEKFNRPFQELALDILFIVNMNDVKSQVVSRYANALPILIKLIQTDDNNVHSNNNNSNHIIKEKENGEYEKGGSGSLSSEQAGFIQARAKFNPMSISDPKRKNFDREEYKRKMTDAYELQQKENQYNRKMIETYELQQKENEEILRRKKEREAQGLPAIIEIPFVPEQPKNNPRNSNVELKKRATRAIGVIAQNNRKIQQIVRKTPMALESVVKLLAHPNDDLKKCAALAINALAENDFANQNAFRQFGVLPLLLTLLQDDDLEDDIKEQAAAAMRSLAKGNQKIQAESRDGVAIPLLVHFMSSSSIGLKIHATGAIMELTRDNAKNSDIVCYAGGVYPLVAALQSENYVVQYLTEGAIWALARKSAKRRNLFLTANVVQPLRTLLMSDHAIVRKGAEWALDVLT